MFGNLIKLKISNSNLILKLYNIHPRSTLFITLCSKIAQLLEIYGNKHVKETI